MSTEAVSSAPPEADRAADRLFASSVRGVQETFDEIGTPLREVTFCVVDLETTGGSPDSSKITEIGAVKVRGGERLGEFQTLVNPAEPIPAFIAVLTGITDSMVAVSPRIEQVLPAFLEFARGCVLVAHNAPFDTGFLRHEARRLGYPWPDFAVVDTALVARRALGRDDAPNCKLGTLARVFHAGTEPNHRALSDARATVDVLHGLFERVGPLGVQTLEELATFTSRVSPAQRAKRHLAEPLPHAPGVYLFTDDRGEVLYIGRSKDLRRRVRSYFTAAETRTRIGEMIGLATGVRGVECATELEASVRELRLIAAHKPRYNRRSRFPERQHWIKVTVEPFPRLSLVKQVRDDGAAYLGPFARRKMAQQAMEAIYEAFPIRQCSQRLSRSPSASPCALAEMDKCLSPCDGRIDIGAYDGYVTALRAAIESNPERIVEAIRRRIDLLVAVQRYEDAGRQRDRLRAFVRTSARMQEFAALSRCAELVGARQLERDRWEIHVVRHGRLVAAGTSPSGVHPRRFLEQLRADAETVLPGVGPVPNASTEEMHLILSWWGQPGVRLVHADGEWTCPLGGAAAHVEWLERADDDQAWQRKPSRPLRPLGPLAAVH